MMRKEVPIKAKSLTDEATPGQIIGLIDEVSGIDEPTAGSKIKANKQARKPSIYRFHGQSPKLTRHCSRGGGWGRHQGGPVPRRSG